MGEQLGDVSTDQVRHTSFNTTVTLSSRFPMFSDLRPLRIPLHSKKSKRCPTCRHILIKPEQKAQSVRYKIKLVAANYLPAISVALPQPKDVASRRAASSARKDATDDSAHTGELQPSATYPFQLALTNPLYDPIQVRLSVQRQAVNTPSSSSADSEAKEKTRRPPFAITLPSSTFPIAAFAEAWEYEDDEDMFGVDEDEFDLDARSPGGALGRPQEGRTKSKAVGVLEKRANVTIVGGEVMIGKEAKGEVKVCHPISSPMFLN